MDDKKNNDKKRKVAALNLAADIASSRMAKQNIVDDIF